MAGNQSEQIKQERSAVAELRKRTDLNKKELEKLSKYEQDLAKEATESKYALLREAEEDAHKKRLENYKKEGKVFKGIIEGAVGSLDAVGKTVGAITSTLTSQIDKSLDKYIDAQQSMAAHLTGVGGGTGSSALTSLTNSLQSTLSATNLVRQERVFDNLVNYVKAGINYNVEQRAFLQTLADDIDLVFNTANGSLAQLIRLQNQDSTANRLAIEYSLQKFLNQNYQTSEYIKDSYETVANALLTSQSLMNTNNAMNFEAAVQTQLGSMYSAGMNSGTISNLATAINALGSGDISNVGTGISNLVLMAAARAGLDYGDILNRGLDATTTNRLLSSLTDYMAEMNDNQSNVVRSQLSSLFGVSITDLMAASNLRQTTGGATTDIGTLFGDYGDFVTFGTGLRNTISNLMFSFGTNMASSPGLLASYEITKMISKSGIGQMLEGVGSTYKNVALQIAGIALSNAQLIPIIASLFGDNGLISDIGSSINASSKGISGIFNSLAGSPNSTVKVSGAGVSGSMYLSSTGTGDILSGSTTSLNEVTSTVTSVEGDKVTLEENVSYIREDVASILEILDTYMEVMSDGITGLATAMAPVTTGIAYAVNGTII